MTYSKFYNFCQQLTPEVSTTDLIQEIERLANVPPVKEYWAEMDIAKIRGFFISAENKEHQFVKQAGGNNVVVLARANNRCYRRFVLIKEMMHLFDQEDEMIGSKDVLERVISELAAPINPTIPTISEYKCIWMAAAAFCPENLRLELQKQRATSQIDDYGIALRLRIPQLYVTNYLFSPVYKQIIDQLIQ